MQVDVQAEMKTSGYEARMVQVIPGKPSKVTMWAWSPPTLPAPA